MAAGWFEVAVILLLVCSAAIATTGYVGTVTSLLLIVLSLLILFLGPKHTYIYIKTFRRDLK